MPIQLLGGPFYGPDCSKWTFLGPKMLLFGPKSIFWDHNYRMVSHGIMIFDGIVCHCMVLYGIGNTVLNSFLTGELASGCGLYLARHLSSL